MPTGDWTEEQAARRSAPPPTGSPRATTRTSATRPRTGSPRSPSTGRRCATPSGPQTVVELSDALERAREDTEVGVIVLTGEGPLAFCSGGDQRVRGDSGYLADDESGGAGRPLPRDRPARADAPPAQAGRGHGGRLRDRRRPRAPRGLRPHHRRRQRPLRPDRAEGRQLRRRLRRRRAGRPGGPEEGQGDLVPLPPVRRRQARADGPGEHRGPARGARGGDGALVPRDARAVAVRAAAAQGQLQRRRGRAGRASSSSPTTPTSSST